MQSGPVPHYQRPGLWTVFDDVMNAGNVITSPTAQRTRSSTIKPSPSLGPDSPILTLILRCYIYPYLPSKIASMKRYPILPVPSKVASMNRYLTNACSHVQPHECIMCCMPHTPPPMYVAMYNLTNVLWVACPIPPPMYVAMYNLTNVLCAASLLICQLCSTNV